MAFIRAKVTSQVWPAKLVVERSCTDGPVNHDFQRCRHAIRMREIVFPGLPKAGYPQVRNRESGQARFRFCTETRRTFIANLTT